MEDEQKVARQRIKSFVERIERLEQEKADLAEDIKEIYAEVKAVGFDVKIMRKIIALRKMDADKRSEEQAILELYMTALGMK